MTRLLSHADLAERFGLRWSRRWLRALVREGKFPQPVMLLGRVAWIESEVEAWVRALPRATGQPKWTEPSALAPPLRRRFKHRRARGKAAEARFKSVCELMA
jgi:predicted DNA-binding transcriptional regulator AlpA